MTESEAARERRAWGDKHCARPAFARLYADDGRATDDYACPRCGEARSPSGWRDYFRKAGGPPNVPEWYP